MKESSYIKINGIYQQRFSITTGTGVSYGCEEKAEYKLVYQRTEKMAFQYPDYLVKENVLAEPLTEAKKKSASSP